MVRVSPGGREGDPYLLTEDALADLARLFERFRAEGLPNGRYRIYLKEVGLPPRQVIEFYKAGDTFGDPVRERGPGSNPVPAGPSAAPIPQEKAAPQSGGPAGARAPSFPGPAAVSGTDHSGHDGGADPDRLQQRDLREHRPHAMDRRQSGRRAGDEFFPDRGAGGEIPSSRRVRGAKGRAEIAGLLTSPRSECKSSA